jgi:arginyl-tRNA synthetase
MRRRAADTVPLSELLDEAREKSLAILRQRGWGGGVALTAPEESGTTLISEEEVGAAAELIGISAVKYADLKNNPRTNYTFSFERMLDLKGNTAVYLLYAVARILSIVRKAAKDPTQLAEHHMPPLTHPTERALAMQLCRFPEVLDGVMDDLSLNRLCEYLYDVSTRFNEFFRDCRVLGDPLEVSCSRQGFTTQNERLVLCEATVLVMKKTLNLLGIEHLEKI